MAECSTEATKALQKLADQTSCAICYETYNDPRVLPCLHIFCKQCLERLVLRESSSDTLQCPQCRTMAKLPLGGVVGFKSAFFVSDLVESYNTLTKALKSSKIDCENCVDSIAIGFCKDCSKFVCDLCTQVHEKWPKLHGHSIISVTEMQANASDYIIPKKSEKHCEKHPKKRLRIFCETCSVVICRDCTLGEHQSHKHLLVSEVAPIHKNDIHKNIQPVGEQVETVASAVASVNSMLRGVSEQSAKVQDSIQREYNELYAALEGRKEELIHNVQHIEQDKTESLVQQKDQLEMLHMQANSCLEFVERSLQNATDAEILNLKAPIIKQAEEIATSIGASQLEPCEMACIKFSANPKLAIDCQHFGHVHDQAICPARCYATGQGLRTAHLDKNTEIMLYTIGEDIKCTKPVDDITCELISSTINGSETVTRATVVKQEGDAYQIHFTPHVRGLNLLHIKIHGKNIQNSPFSVFVYNTEPITISGVEGPYGVALTESGEMVVAENQSHRITIIGRHDTKPRYIGNSDLKCPCGVATDSDGNIVASDDCCIRKFDKDGTLIKSVGAKGSGELEFSTPRGIAINSTTGKIYIADRHNHRVQVLNKDLTFSHQFGSAGSKPG